MKNDQNSIQLNPIQTEFLIPINPNESELEMIPSESEIFRNLFSKHSESFRTNPKKMLYRLIENDQKSIQLNPIQTELLILINPNESGLN